MICAECSSSDNSVTIAVAVLIGAAAAALFLFKNSFPKQLLDHAPLNILKQLDRGKLKVLWITYQLLSTISWNLSLAFPYPFSVLLFYLGFLQLDFLSLDCARLELDIKRLFVPLNI